MTDLEDTRAANGGGTESGGLQVASAPFFPAAPAAAAPRPPPRPRRRGRGKPRERGDRRRPTRRLTPPAAAAPAGRAIRGRPAASELDAILDGLDDLGDR